MNDQFSHPSDKRAAVHGFLPRPGDGFSLPELMENGGRKLVTLCLREMAREDYAAYLRTNHWREVRWSRLKLDEFKCFVCLSTRNLNVHHVRYNNLGDEAMDDLITLCRDHHDAHHAILAAQIRKSIE